MKKISADLKKDFPILSRSMNGKPLIYLDNAATTQKPLQVIDAISKFYKESNANIHRGVYTLAEEATQEYENTRIKVARFINSSTHDNIIFTRSKISSIGIFAEIIFNRRPP